jgi:hypothetical protein
VFPRIGPTREGDVRGTYFYSEASLVWRRWLEALDRETWGARGRSQSGDWRSQGTACWVSLFGCFVRAYFSGALYGPAKRSGVAAWFGGI